MRSIIGPKRLLGAGVFVAALLAFAPAGGAPDSVRPGRTVSYLREVRPILAQHCFQCHGPDQAARKGKLRLDLKEQAFARRHGKRVIAPGDLGGSLAWERITAHDEAERMPPAGRAQPLSEKQVATLKAWIEQGARWEEHWSLLPPTKPALPPVSNKAWVRDPLDAFVLARLERERLKPEAEASREAWLRRVSFDLTGLPPTPAEIDEFLKDRGSDAHERQVDRLLKSPRYGERQAQEWLDLARYADTNGYQNDTPRKAWKWREWVIHAYNDNMPFNQFAVEQLAGDLLPDATLAQRIATGFNRNHPTNSEAGEEEDEYRSAYVIDRVNTTATAFLGLTMACAQCHDHKYDPISQRDFYSFYSFFNNVKERDADYANPRPTLAVPNPDQAPRLADLKARIAALKRRLDRDDPLADAEQRAWERAAQTRLGRPVRWTTMRPSAMLSRNGAVLKLLDDGSVLSAGPAPVRDTYDVMLLPGKGQIAALRLEVLPDDSQPHGALGRASDGCFSLSAIEVRHASLADSQDPPLVYLSRAEADLNQKPKEDPSPSDMFPGSVESAVVVEPVAAGFARGHWSIVGDERKRPHEAVFLSLEPIETNEASVLRVSLHQAGGRPFKSLIGRFRLSYTEDNRIRELLLPAQTKLWSSIGPFPAEDAQKAYTTAFAPEKDIKGEPLDLRKTYDKVVLPPPTKEAPAKAGDKPEKLPPPKVEGAAGKDDAKPAKAKDKEKVPEAKAAVKEAAGKDQAKAKPERVTWVEQRTWRDGSPASLTGGNSAYYLTRKVVSTGPRTVTVQIDGPAGFKVWLNGEPVQTSVPPPAPPPPPKKEKDATKPNEDSDEPTEAAIDFEAMMGRGRSKTEKKFRLGLRQGENEVVLKVVYAAGGPGPRGPFPGAMAGPGGGSFTFHLTPEGDDVLTHEVATALRLEAEGRTKPAAPVAAPTGKAVPPSPPADATKPEAKKDEPKKVSLVGEKTAPPRPEEEDKLSPAERRRKVLREHFRTRIDPVGRLLAEELAKLKDEERQLKREMPETLVMEELDKPRQAYVFLRGLYKNRGEGVSPATPQALPPMAKDLPPNRLGLARWLVSGKNPLTARVLVNRIWQQYFGLGLVRTAEDFGVRGELPTHPDLLDYLATELVESRWDLKKLHRRIVLSATYRQAATASREKLERDPENRLLARGPRVRLTAEMVRDNALAVSGLLFEKLGGESVKPPQPASAPKAAEEGVFAGPYRRDRGERQYRRGLYVHWQRGSPYPSMLNFDGPKRDACTVTRAATTTPLQALTLLNDPVYVECAKVLGRRMLKDREALGRARGLSKAEEDARRLAYGFRLCTSRPPTEQEATVLRKLLDDQRAHFKADAAAAKKLLAVGDAKIDASLEVAEVAAWASVGNALLNLDATIHR
ncbi:MAG: PSD1 and planctomycete cytochrome C domain-containing protein [Gemmataceae bacterium]